MAKGAEEWTGGGETGEDKGPDQATTSQKEAAEGRGCSRRAMRVPKRLAGMQLTTKLHAQALGGLSRQHLDVCRMELLYTSSTLGHGS